MLTQSHFEALYRKIYLFFAGDYEFYLLHRTQLSDIVFWIKIVALFLSLIFSAGIVYCILRLFKTRKKELREFVKFVLEHSPEVRVTRWDKIKEYLKSDNSSDWRRAIIEADALLEDIIKRIGYRGDTFGERLSQIKPAQFKNLNQLWEAHKVRNRIAHEMDYKLSKYEAERTIDFYEKALNGLGYIS